MALPILLSAIYSTVIAVGICGPFSVALVCTHRAEVEGVWHILVLFLTTCPALTGAANFADVTQC